MVGGGIVIQICWTRHVALWPHLYLVMLFYDLEALVKIGRICVVNIGSGITYQWDFFV